jgi:cytochrome c oxidase cbb3-type subunit III
MTPRRVSAAAPFVVMLATLACEREARRFDDRPAAPAAGSTVRLSPIEAGPSTKQVTVAGPYDDNAYDAAQGKRLFTDFNCTGCHGNGGGASGPALMDDMWIYGSEPENIFASIVQGRPNGMPSFQRLQSQQVWQLVAYVRSLSGLLRKDVAPGRDDHMQRKAQEQSTDRMRPREARPEPSGQP